MALTPEQVVNKRFQPTKFREGYDQDEVDDFLDEVVNELRRLTSENEELREKLGACERRVGELTRAGARTEAAEPAAATGAPDVPAQSQPVAETAPETASETTPETAPAGSTASATAQQDAPEAATSMLALAQKLHDDYVRNGQQERDRIVGEAREHATRLVQEAEERQRDTLGSLERERSLLERKIDELRAFERDYRTRLRAYLEGQLRELDTQGVVAPDGSSASAG